MRRPREGDGDTRRDDAQRDADGGHRKGPERTGFTPVFLRVVRRQRLRRPHVRPTFRWRRVGRVLEEWGEGQRLGGEGLSELCPTRAPTVEAAFAAFFRLVARGSLIQELEMWRHRSLHPIFYRICARAPDEERSPERAFVRLQTGY